MRVNEEWKSADQMKRLFMVITHLADGKMKQEKKYMGWYGAVRLTKKETEDMVSGNYRNVNFW
eukprot:8486987-Heterocapsa_arctica.AAC.1